MRARMLRWRFKSINVIIDLDKHKFYLTRVPQSAGKKLLSNLSV